MSSSEKRKFVTAGIGGSTAATRGLVITAFAAIYLIWGSTYLAIRFAIETLPPFLMGGGRFLLAGLMDETEANNSTPPDHSVFTEGANKS